MAAAAIAALTDPLTVALGATKPLPGQASQWQGWTLTDLKSDGEWRRGSLVVPGDGLGDAEIMLSYARSRNCKGCTRPWFTTRPAPWSRR